MKLERSDVEFPLWRKKVDKSLFEHSGTTIPVWACRMWNLVPCFGEICSRLDERAKVTVSFEGVDYEGWITTAKHGRSSSAMRLWYQEELSIRLKYTFLMSYMRSLEQRLAKGDGNNIEAEIPFWEFLDIEYDQATRRFRFVAYYKQEPSFPNLFHRLIESPGLKRVADEIEGRKEKRIHKQDWRPRNQLAFEVGATNVLYLLLDTQEKLIYAGEARDLVSRLSQPHPSIPKWDFFRYSVLPDVLGPFRVALERMLIRDLAGLLPNKKGIPSMLIDGFGLANDRVDR
jgi:hypothetical protein